MTSKILATSAFVRALRTTCGFTVVRMKVSLVLAHTLTEQV